MVEVMDFDATFSGEIIVLIPIDHCAQIKDGTTTGQH